MTDHPPSQATDLVATHTIADVARLLGVSENAVRKRIRCGTLPARKEGDRWLVAILENHQQPDGCVRVPEALVPFVGTEVLEPTKS